MMNMNNFRGDLTAIAAENEALVSRITGKSSWVEIVKTLLRLQRALAGDDGETTGSSDE